MRCIPILFNTEMTQAILTGRKTQTRRIVKNQDGIHPRWNNVGWVGWDDGHGYRMKPPCEVGDILWVRETWADIPQTYPGNFHYKASATPEDLEWFSENGWKWRPSIHMPKGAARIFLRVKDVRIERLRDITDEDALREGAEEHRTVIPIINYGGGSATEDFFRIWNSTIPAADRDRFGWQANPWVWVIKFERSEKPERWCAE